MIGCGMDVPIGPKRPLRVLRAVTTHSLSRSGWVKLLEAKLINLGSSSGQVLGGAALKESLLDCRAGPWMPSACSASWPRMLCDHPEETMTHRLTGCSFSRMVWHEVLSRIRSMVRPLLRGTTSRTGGIPVVISSQPRLGKTRPRP